MKKELRERTDTDHCLKSKNAPLNSLVILNRLWFDSKMVKEDQMDKQLNPALFSANSSEKVSDSKSWYIDPASSLRFDRPIDRAEFKKMEDRCEVINDRVTETIKTSSLKSEKVSQRVAQVESRVDALAQEIRSKYAQLSGRVTERNLMETEVQSMLDRHNQVVRNFENRMVQMQRLVENQQIMLMNSQAALEESRRELARLKRI
jgi:DNA polymerase II small subunit/DNA polymerase delta subunit B